MNYPRLLVTIGLLAICSFTLVHNSRTDHEPPLHLLLNQQPVDMQKELSINSKGYLGILMMDADGSAEALQFRIMLVGDHKPGCAPLQIKGSPTLARIPIQSILQHARPGDDLIIEITNLRRPVCYTIRLGT